MLRRTEGEAPAPLTSGGHCPDPGLHKQKVWLKGRGSLYRASFLFYGEAITRHSGMAVKEDALLTDHYLYFPFSNCNSV